MNNITIGDGHGSRSSSNRGWESGSGCSIGRDHSVGRMLIGLVTLSSLETGQFSLPVFDRHLLEDIRSNKLGMLFAISSNKEFGVGRSTRNRRRQRRFAFLGLGVGFMSATSSFLKDTLSLIKVNGILFDMIK